MARWSGLERESQSHSAKKAEIYLGDVFKRLKPVFVTITSGEAGAATYVDGTLVKRFPNFAFSSLDLRGQLIVGSAPETAWNWPGQFKGLAVYDRELTADVVKHYERQRLLKHVDGSAIKDHAVEKIMGLFRP